MRKLSLFSNFRPNWAMNIKPIKHAFVWIFVRRWEGLVNIFILPKFYMACKFYAFSGIVRILALASRVSVSSECRALSSVAVFFYFYDSPKELFDAILFANLYVCYNCIYASFVRIWSQHFLTFSLPKIFETRGFAKNFRGIPRHVKGCQGHLWRSGGCSSPDGNHRRRQGEHRQRPPTRIWKNCCRKMVLFRKALF